MPGQSKTGPLSPKRIAALTAQGLLDPSNHHWYLSVPRDEASRVYTLRAKAGRKAMTAKRRLAKQDGRDG